MPYQNQIEIASGPRVIKCYLIKADMQAQFEEFCANKIRPWLEGQANVTQCDAWLMKYDGKLMLVVSMWESDFPWDTIVGLADFLETVSGKNEYEIIPVPSLHISRTTEQAADAYAALIAKIPTVKPIAKGASS